MTWTWRLEDAAGAEVALGDPAPAPAPAAYASQSDAENWLGEHWRELADAGVAQARLLDGDTEVYGPMPLAEG